MRTQQEIINKINDIRQAGADPTKVQIRTLVRKLSWNNAKDLLHPLQRVNPNIKKRWDITSSVDRGLMMQEIHELMYQAYEHVIDFQMKKCLILFQTFIIYAWLLRDDILLRELLRKFEMGGQFNEKHIKYYFKGVWDLICDNFGLRIATYCRDWELDTPPDDPHIQPSEN